MMALQYSNRPHRSRLLSRSRRNLLTRLHADANKSRVSIGADYQASDDQRGDGGSSPAAPEGQRDARPAGNEGRVEFWKSPRPRTSSTPEGSISTTARSSPAERADTTASKASLDGLPTNEASKPAPMTLSYRVGHQQVAAGDRAVRDRSEKAKKKKTSEALQEEGGSRSAEPAKGDGKPKNSKQQARRGGTKWVKATSERRGGERTSEGGGIGRRQVLAVLTSRVPRGNSNGIDEAPPAQPGSCYFSYNKLYVTTDAISVRSKLHLFRSGAPLTSRHTCHVVLISQLGLDVGGRPSGGHERISA